MSVENLQELYKQQQRLNTELINLKSKISEEKTKIVNNTIRYCSKCDMSDINKNLFCCLNDDQRHYLCVKCVTDNKLGASFEDENIGFYLNPCMYDPTEFESGFDCNYLSMCNDHCKFMYYKSDDKGGNSSVERKVSLCDKHYLEIKNKSSNILSDYYNKFREVLDRVDVSESNINKLGEILNVKNEKYKSCSLKDTM
jgi:hypothetical protein